MGDIDWKVELVHAGVTLASVLTGGGVSFFATRYMFWKQTEKEREAEKERVRREVLTVRLRAQSDAIASYIEVFNRWNTEPMELRMMPSGQRAIEGDKIQERLARAIRDASLLVEKVAHAFQTSTFAKDAAMSIELVSLAIVHPALAQRASDVAVRFLGEMEKAREETVRALDVGAKSYVPRAVHTDEQLRSENKRILVEGLLLSTAKNDMEREKVRELWLAYFPEKGWGQPPASQ